MADRDVDLLRSYLEAFPEFRDRVKLSPLRVFWQNRWKAVREVRKLESGLEVLCCRGARVPLIPSTSARSARERLRRRLLALIRSNFVSVCEVNVLDKTDRSRHQTEAILRAHLRAAGESILVLAVYESESPELSSRLLTSLILWWAQVRKADRAAIFLPESWSERVVALFPYLTIPLVCYKYRLDSGRLRQVYPKVDQVSIVRAPYVIYPMWTEAPRPFSHLVQEFSSLDLLYRGGRWEVCYRGFPLVWTGEGGTPFYDLQNPKKLTDLSSIRHHIRVVMTNRTFPPPCSNHLHFRFGEERWLESLVMRNYRRISRKLTGQIYSQVPTRVGTDHRVLDLLAVTSQGRLAVMELKTQKDLSLLLQGLDYWERVEHHRIQGDFGPAGYFGGVKLLEAPPLLYLICPLFEFHQVLAVIRPYLRGDFAVFCIGINSDWKREFRILRKFEL